MMAPPRPVRERVASLRVKQQASSSTWARKASMAPPERVARLSTKSQSEADSEAPGSSPMAPPRSAEQPENSELVMLAPAFSPTYTAPPRNSAWQSTNCMSSRETPVMSAAMSTQPPSNSLLFPNPALPLMTVKPEIEPSIASTLIAWSSAPSMIVTAEPPVPMTSTSSTVTVKPGYVPGGHQDLVAGDGEREGAVDVRGITRDVQRSAERRARRERNHRATRKQTVHFVSPVNCAPDSLSGSSQGTSARIYGRTDSVGSRTFTPIDYIGFAPLQLGPTLFSDSRSGFHAHVSRRSRLPNTNRARLGFA
jgi:hypothetical protein